MIYTFEPKVNESLRKLYKKDKISASKRLYNDSFDRQKQLLLQQKIFYDESKIVCGKNFNNNKYIELYEDSKLRKEKNEDLIRKIEKNCGYTFAPKIMHKKIDLTNKNNYMILNEKKDKEKKIQKNKSFCYSENNKNIRK